MKQEFFQLCEFHDYLYTFEFIFKRTYLSRLIISRTDFGFIFFSFTNSLRLIKLNNFLCNSLNLIFLLRYNLTNSSLAEIKTVSNNEIFLGIKEIILRTGNFFVYFHEF